MLIYCSNLIFFLYSQPLLYRFVDIVHEAPLSGQWQPRSIVGGTLYCIYLASKYLLAFLCFVNSDRPCYYFRIMLERLPSKQFHTCIYPRNYMFLISAINNSPLGRVCVDWSVQQAFIVNMLAL